MTQFLKDRRRLLTAAVMKDDWESAKAYCKKYGVPIPDDEMVMKAGIYKAVQECTDIPQDVKNVAIEKCLKIGFEPFIRPEQDKTVSCGMLCYYCGERLGWESDESFLDDNGEEGIVSYYECKNCGTWYEIYRPSKKGDKE